MDELQQKIDATKHAVKVLEQTLAELKKALDVTDEPKTKLDEAVEDLFKGAF